MDRGSRGAGRSLLGFVLLAVAVILPMSDARAAVDFSGLRRSTPYVPLFTETNNCSEIKTVNNLTGTELDSRLGQLTSWFRHFHGEASAQLFLGDLCRGASSTTLASKLAARGAWASNYRNGSYVSQATSTQPMNFDEAADLEAAASTSIATFWAGNAKTTGTGDDTIGAARLSQALDATATTVKVTSAAAQRPSGAPTTWPFLNSRGTGLNAGAHSANTHDFVSWIRLEDELAQIVADPVEANGVVTLTVRRGIWGTGAASHGQGARVMSPVYIGSTNAAASDGNLAGGPNRNDTNYPLRYGIKIWQPGGYTWIANRIKATFGTGLQGYNAVWLDVSSCNQYNNADGLGQPVFGWDDPVGTKLTQARWGTHQKTKVAGLRAALPGVLFTANNLTTATTCADDLLANAYDGGVLEHWMKAGVGGNPDWATSMAQNFRIQAGNWPALYWARWNYDFTGDPAQYKRFSYGSLLLAYRPSATRFQYGGAWGLQRPDDLFFWDWGAPLTNPAGVADEKLAGLELYRRDFGNGMILVNPSAAAVTYTLPGQYYDAVHTDAAGDPTPVTSVTVPAKDAAFLLKAPSSTTTTTTTTTTSTTTTSTTTTSTTTTSTTTTTTTAPPAADSTAPDTAIGSLSGNRKKTTFGGSATDDRGVTAVRLAIKDQSTGLWWHTDGSWGAFQSTTAKLGTTGARSTTWSFTWTPPGNGSYGIQAVGWDAAGNYDSSSAWRTFQVAPSSTALT